MSPRNASIYLRISSDPTGQAAGVERQREDCERFARERGWSVAAIHTDNDMSGSTGKRRPGFEALLADVSSGRAGVVVAWSLDRLQRNRADEARLYEACRERGAILALVNGPTLDFTTAAGRFVADALGGVARMEVELKAERQRRANLQAAQRGARVSGRRPFGYDDDGVTVRADEADAVRDGYRALLAGVPLAGIARDWNRRGLRTGQGGSWRHDNVRAVLLNPRYAGKRAYRGEVVADAVWPALVPEDTWQAAVALLRNPARRRAAYGGKRLLTGVARCGVCGATVHAGGSQRRGEGMYRCSAAAHVHRRSDPVDEYVSAVAVARLSRPDAADLLHDTDRPDVDELRDEASGLRARLDALAVDFADGTLTASQLRAATTRLRQRLHEVEQQLADAGRVNVLGPLVTGEAGVVWEALDVDRRRAVIDALMTVTLMPPGRGVRVFRPETVLIEWRDGDE